MIRDAGQSCSNLAEATAVAVAIVLDQPPASQEKPPAPPPQPSVPAQPASTQDRRPEKPEDEPAFSPAVALEGGVALAVLEHPVPTVELSAQGRFGRAFYLAMGVGAFGRDQVELGERRVELSLLEASLRACLNAYAERAVRASPGAQGRSSACSGGKGRTSIRTWIRRRS